METERNITWGSRIIFAIIIGFVFGILLASFVFISPLISVLILLVGISILVAEKIYTGEVVKEVLFLSIILISFSLGALRYAVKDFHEVQMPSNHGVVVSEPEQKDNTTRFVVRTDNGEKVQVSADLYSPVQYGDEVKLGGQFKVPGIIVDEDSGREFDYGKYLSKDDIYYTLSFAKVEIISSGNGNKIKSTLFKLKKNFIIHAKSILAEPYASLLMGLIVSGREALPADILEEFRRAGVIHIVVLSGFNITLIANFLKRLFRSYSASIIGIILFVIMTGAGASIVRAAVMALIATGGKFLGRQYSASRALVVAAFLMLLQNPKILVFDPSFQLSFLATLGLIYFMDPVKRRLGWVTERLELRDILSQTFATQITVLPLLIYMSGDVSLVSIPANLLILVTVPYTMLIGFMAVIGSYVSTFLIWPVSYLAYLMLSWILSVAHTLGGFSFATLAIPNVSIWIVGVFYLAIFLLLYWRYAWDYYRENGLPSATRGE